MRATGTFLQILRRRPRSGRATAAGLFALGCVRVTTDYDDSAAPRAQAGSAGTSEQAPSDGGSTGSGGSTGGAPSTASGGATGGRAAQTGGTSSSGGGSGGLSPAGGAATTTGGAEAAGSGGSSATGGAPSGGAETGGSATGGSSAAGASGIGCDGFVFCDDFEDASADGWTTSGGTWAVVSDTSWVYQGGNGSQEAVAGQQSWTDQTVEARVKVVSFGGNTDSYRVGILARYTGSSNFYALAVGADGNLTLRKSTSQLSGCDPVASGIDPSAWFTLKLEVSGPASAVQIRTYINDTLAQECAVTDGLASGQVGVVTYGSSTDGQFDDIRVSTP